MFNYSMAQQFTSSYQANVPLHPSLPTTATSAHFIPNLQHSLLLLGQLCDDGCIATFDKTTVSIDYNNDTIIVGYCSPITKLWHIALSTW
jgi:hypothetical protein